jgi:branched-chain amino acid transport system substrate-binding protein
MQGQLQRTWRTVAAIAAVMALAAACGGGDDEEEAGDTTETTAAAEGGSARGNVNGVLDLGYLLPSSGDLAALGPPMIKGFEMAVRDINGAGGVLGSDVVVSGADDGTSPDVASAALDQLLASSRIDAFVGAASSTTTRGILGKVREAGVVECSPSNTAADLAEIESGGYYFRTAPPDDLQGPALADLIVADGHSRVAIIALNDEYGQGFSEFLRQGLEEAGAEVVADVAYDPRGTTFDADVRQVVDADPDAVALISFPDTGANVLSTMIELGAGPANLPLYTADGMQSSTLGTQVDPNNAGVVQGIKGTAPSAAPEGGRQGFAEEFAQFAPGVDTIYSAHSYDCATVIALAAEAAQSDDPADIKDEMVAVTTEGQKCTRYQECKDLLADGEDIDYDGASGPLEFTDRRQPSQGTYDIWQFDAQGAVQTLDQVQVSEDA